MSGKSFRVNVKFFTDISHLAHQHSQRVPIFCAQMPGLIGNNRRITINNAADHLRTGRLHHTDLRHIKHLIVFLRAFKDLLFTNEVHRIIFEPQCFVSSKISGVELVTIYTPILQKKVLIHHTLSYFLTNSKYKRHFLFLNFKQNSIFHHLLIYVLYGMRKYR